MNEASLIQELAILDVLRRLFLHGPQPDWLQHLAEHGAQQDGDSDGAMALHRLAAAVGTARAQSLTWRDDLAVEFTRLFIGPAEMPAVPYASFYLSPSRSLMTDETLAVRERYRQAGVAVEQLNRIPDDHIGVELEFLYFLTLQTLEARKTGNAAEPDVAVQTRQTFLAEHFVRWVPEFVELIEANATEPVFQAVARLLSVATQTDEARSLAGTGSFPQGGDRVSPWSNVPQTREGNPR